MTDQNDSPSRKDRTSTEPGRIRVVGALDQDSVSDGFVQAWLWQQTIRPDGPAEIVVDLDGCTFCDSTGLNILLQARREAVAHGRTVRLVSPRPQLVRILRRTGTIDLFSISLIPTPPAA
ncbi:STAS domain-containing protein [Streptomyces sp. NPDC101733]|uniref:STAS domain-containing protein n=1 Tax=unclassified Streptomyces TaxID=2593676 RepID=UPI00381B6DD7